MKILLQHLGNGRTTLEDVPAPCTQAGHVLIRTTRSVVSAGTERMLVEFGRGNLLQKARQQPERVQQVLNKMRTDGVLPTIQTVRRKLDQPIPLGYCNAGVVVGVGAGVEGFAVGDRVVSNGHHAEVVSVPKNLVAKIPDDVRDEDAAFAPLAAIALHGFRLSEARVGDTVVVIGLGLVGTLAGHWASIAGCRVIGFDVSAAAVERPVPFDIQAYNLTTANAEAVVRSLTGGRGADVVLVCTSTASADPLNTAVTVCRAGGSVVLIGTAGIELQRRPLFDKEIRLQVSRNTRGAASTTRYSTRGGRPVET
jgi:threonine dehydrogenase-like Zn-dependent dehydrogenase